jgi:general secretion pathway protein H
MTERAAIQIRIGDSEEEGQTMTVLVAPLTGKVTVKSGPQELQLPTDDATASDRQDQGY